MSEFFWPFMNLSNIKSYKWNIPHFIEGATAHYYDPNFIIFNTPKSTKR